MSFTIKIIVTFFDITSVYVFLCGTQRFGDNGDLSCHLFNESNDEINFLSNVHGLSVVFLMCDNLYRLNIWQLFSFHREVCGFT